MKYVILYFPKQNKCGQVLLSSKIILQMVKTYHAKYKILLKSKSEKASGEFDNNLVKFREEANII